MSLPPPFLPFKQNVEAQRLRLKEMVRTENADNFIEYLKGKKAAQAFGLIPQTNYAGLRLASADVDDVKGIIEKGATDQQEAFGKFKDEVQDLKNDPSIKDNQPAWKTKITEKKEALKQDVNKKIDKMADDTINKIDQLPPAKQDAAGDAAVSSMDVVGGLLNTLLGEAGKVLGMIWDFFKGIWEGLKKAFQTVVNAVGSVVNTIGGFFKGIFLALPPDESKKQWETLIQSSIQAAVSAACQDIGTDIALGIEQGLGGWLGSLGNKGGPGPEAVTGATTGHDSATIIKPGRVKTLRAVSLDSQVGDWVDQLKRAAEEEKARQEATRKAIQDAIDQIRDTIIGHVFGQASAAHVTSFQSLVGQKAFPNAADDEVNVIAWDWADVNVPVQNSTEDNNQGLVPWSPYGGVIVSGGGKAVPINNPEKLFPPPFFPWGQGTGGPPSQKLDPAQAQTRAGPVKTK